MTFASLRTKFGSFSLGVGSFVMEVESFFWGLIVFVFLPSQLNKTQLKKKSITSRMDRIDL